MNHSTVGVIVPDTVESWTCEIETDLNQFSENLEADTVAVWMLSSIGHRSPGFNPFKSEMGAGGMFIGDGPRALVSISARVYRRGRLSIVIERYAPEKEDSGDLAPWAEVGQTVVAWLRGWIREHYKVEPVAQRAGLPSWDDYNMTGDQEHTKPRGTKVGNPGRASHAKAIQRLQAGEDEKTVRADWRNDYADDTGMYPDDMESGESELWRKNVKSKV